LLLDDSFEHEIWTEAPADQLPYPPYGKRTDDWVFKNATSVGDAERAVESAEGSECANGAAIRSATATADSASVKPHAVARKKFDVENKNQGLVDPRIVPTTIDRAPRETNQPLFRTNQPLFRTDHYRIILIVDLWHPELSEAERSRLVKMGT
jgi:hypothetical protein